MNLIFMGTPEFAVASLDRLLSSRHQVAAVVTATDKPSGRGRKLKASPVKKKAINAGCPVLQPQSLNAPQFISALKQYQADCFVVVAFRILPPQVFQIPPKGTFNLHASLLPKYRGAAPINWALINGESESGITTFFIDENVDTGHLLLQKKVSISKDMTAGELHDLLMQKGADLVLETVNAIENDRIEPIAQKGTITKAPKLSKELCRIDWTQTAFNVHNLIRGLSPTPGAYSNLNGKRIQILRSKIVESDSSTSPGTVVDIVKNGPVIVQTGKEQIMILQVKPQGKRIMSIEEFVRGYPINVGDRFAG